VPSRLHATAVTLLRCSRRARGHGGTTSGRSGPGRRPAWRRAKHVAEARTTRHRNRGVLRYLRHSLGAQTARASACWALAAASRRCRACRRAACQWRTRRRHSGSWQSTPRLVLAPASFAQADARPRSSRPGTRAALWLNMTAAHGSVLSQGTARGERAIVLLGRFSRGKKRLEQGAAKETMKTRR